MRKKYPQRRKSASNFSYQALEPRQLLAAMPIISEFLASNGSATDRDDNGNSSDWIEIYNAGDAPINMAGYTLTDDADATNKWTFPSRDLAVGQYLVVWAATDSNPAAGSDLYTGFALSSAGEYVGLYDPSGTVVSEYAVGGSNYPEQYQDISYGVRFDTGNFDQVSYFRTPTLGRSNFNPVLGVMGRVQASVAAGFYETAQQVTLETSIPGATIRYTLDDSTPTGSKGLIYSGPITVSSTTNLRAVAFLTNYVTIPSRTWSYIFVDDVISQSPNGERPPGWPTNWGGNSVDYGMDPQVIAAEGAQRVKDALLAIPTWSITTDFPNLFDPNTGIYANASQDGINWERPASVEQLNPDGSPGFQVNAGLRIRGGFSRSSSNPKHSFRLFFRSEYGDSELNYPVHTSGVDTFEKIDLRTAQNYSWSFSGDPSNKYIVDGLSRLSQLAVGQPSTHSTWLHLYINGQYWGLYQTQERADGDYGASYFGGNASDFDVIKPEGANQNVATEGNLDAYHELFQQAIARAADGSSPNFINNDAYLKAQGLNPDGSRNANYKVLLDVDNLIGYMTVILAAGNMDAPIVKFNINNRLNNYFAIRDRTGDEGFRFFAHDAEHSMLGVNDDANGPFNHANFQQAGYFNPQWLHEQLMANEDYRIRFADSIYKNFFNDGPMTTENQLARVNAEAAILDQAIMAESARWGDAKTSSPLMRSHWLNAINGLRTYTLNRNAVVLNQFRSTKYAAKGASGSFNIIRSAPLFPQVNAPDFLVDGSDQHGGIVTEGSELHMLSNAPLIYYTLDGSDPRLPGGEISPSALVFNSPSVSTTVVASGDSWKYWDQGTNLGPFWRQPGYNDSSWSVGQSQLGYGDGDETTVVSYGADPNNKHIATYFRKKFDLAPAAYNGATLRLKRDDGAVVYLNGVEIVRDNMPATVVNFNTFAASVAEDDTFYEFFIDPGLLQVGENSLAVEVHQNSVSSTDISFDLELIVSAPVSGSSPIQLDSPQVLRARARSIEGDWSAIHDAAFFFESASKTDIRISEINYHPYQPTPSEIAAGFADADKFDFVEIFNSHIAESVNLNGMQLADGVTFAFGDVNLGPGERAVVVEDVSAFQARYGTSIRILGEWSGALSNGGESLTLLDDGDAIVMSVTYDDVEPWYPSTDGLGSTLELIDPAGTPVNDLGEPASWQPSINQGGSPGAASVPPPAPQVVSTLRDGGSVSRPDLWSTYRVVFNEDVDLDASSLIINNATTGGLPVDLSGISFNYDNTTFTATWDFAGLATKFPAAYFTAELNAATITNVSSGTALDGDANGVPGGNHRNTVYVAIPGDANLDGDVDVYQLIFVDGQFQNVGDLAILKSNLGNTTNVGWSSGDFNGDGDVDVFDFRLGVGNVGDLGVLYANLDRNVGPPAGATNARIAGSDPKVGDTIADAFVGDFKDGNQAASEMIITAEVPESASILATSSEATSSIVLTQPPTNPLLNLIGTPLDRSNRPVAPDSRFDSRLSTSTISTVSAAATTQLSGSIEQDLKTQSAGQVTPPSLLDGSSEKATADGVRDQVFNNLSDVLLGWE